MTLLYTREWRDTTKDICVSPKTSWGCSPIALLLLWNVCEGTPPNAMPKIQRRRDAIKDSSTLHQVRALCVVLPTCLYDGIVC
jgi:hypothetical protein